MTEKTRSQVETNAGLMTYTELKTALKPFKTGGLTDIKLNASKTVLEAEYNRLISNQQPPATKAEMETAPPTSVEIETVQTPEAEGASLLKAEDKTVQTPEAEMETAPTTEVEMETVETPEAEGASLLKAEDKTVQSSSALVQASPTPSAEDDKCDSSFAEKDEQNLTPAQLKDIRFREKTIERLRKEQGKKELTAEEETAFWDRVERICQDRQRQIREAAEKKAKQKAEKEAKLKEEKEAKLKEEKEAKRAKEEEAQKNPPKRYKILAGNGCHQAIGEIQAMLVPPTTEEGKFSLILPDGLQIDASFKTAQIHWLATSTDFVQGMHWFRGYPKVSDNKLVGYQIIAWDGEMVNNKGEKWEFIGVWTAQRNITVQRTMSDKEIRKQAKETGFIKKFKYTFTNSFDYKRNLWVGYVYKLRANRKGDTFEIRKVIPYACPRIKPKPPERKPPTKRR